MQVDPAELHAKASELVTASNTGETDLGGARSEATGARPGFPGDASGPFDKFVSALETSDTGLISAMRQIASQMRQGASDYTRTDYDNSCRM